MTSDRHGSDGVPDHSWESQQPTDGGLIEIAIVLARYKKAVVGVPLIAAIVAVGVTMAMPDVYTARSVLMPPQQQQSSASLVLGQLGAFAGMTGAGIGLKNPSDLYVGILKSHSISDAVIEKFGLQEAYGEKTLIDARQKLQANSSFSSGKDGLIVIEVDDRDARKAAEMANEFVEQLKNLTSGLAMTEGAQRRMFFEQQLAEAKRNLETAEGALKSTQERTGLIQLDQQGKAMIEAIATLRARIVTKEVELSAIRTYSTDANPDVQRLQQELAGLRAELVKLERGDSQSSWKNIPTAGLDYMRRYRDLKYSESLFELLAKQYELAKIDESKDAGIIQVVDVAKVPDRKSAPQRGLIVVVVGIFAALLTLVGVFLAEARRRMQATEDGAKRLGELRRTLRWR